jgi:leader peptidase (prepilin peptidase) / N-methyltransferase
MPEQDGDHPEQLSVPSLTPNLLIFTAGTGASALVSFLYLPWPFAIASTILAIFMVAGADVDSRTFLLPDVVTYGALICGILAAPLLDWTDPWYSLGGSILRAAVTCLFLGLLRKAFIKFRGLEGLGFGDVKLAAAIGAWLPFELIPSCFGLATTAALLSIIVRWRGETLDGLKLPFGAFLCPALWLVFFADSLSR